MSTEPASYHEGTSASRSRFVNYVRKFHNKMICNHFELDELIIIKNKNVVSISDISEQVKPIETEGRNHFTLFQKK